MASCCGAVEGESGVGLREVVVTADLDGPVAGVGDLDRDRGGVVEQLDVAIAGDDLTGCDLASDVSGHPIGSWIVTSLVPSGNVASTCTSGIISATPSITSARDRKSTRLNSSH